jgi:adenosylcobinamide kinase/adenosylcobinamide-phosphate guanylyltransferase
MKRVTLITGGAASGKSRYACERAAEHGPRVLFIATCIPGDEEMRAKVGRHRAERPPGWRTEERSRGLAGALAPECDAAVVDCLTLLVAQMLLGGAAEREILDEVTSLVADPPCPLFVVTNEVGWGIVPEAALGRRFREVLGRANRIAAGRADEVVLMVSGLPVRIKGEP